MSGTIRKLLFGDANIREYVTITVRDGIQERVLFEANKSIIDVSANQWLLCLDPLIFGVWLPIGNDDIVINENAGYKMHFLTKGKNGDIATVILNYFDSIKETDGTLVLLKLKQSKIFHLDPIRMWALFLKYYKKPGLSFFKLKGFAAAYSYPRKVRVISFKEDDYYNIFPMDLLGGIQSGNHYVLGLRHTNSALLKIIATKKLVISEVSCQHKDVIYQLGSHHVGGAPAVENLPFKTITSKKFGFYLPEWVNSYKEITITKTINLGSHMLLCGEVVGDCQLKADTGNLFHIHYLLYLHKKKKGNLYPDV